MYWSLFHYNWILGCISVPVIAQVWVIPIQIFYFNNISIYSVFANIMSVPILSIISFGGFVSSLLSILKPFAYKICEIFDFILEPFLVLLVKISDFWGALPNSTVQTSHPTILQLILYYSLILVITGFMYKEFREKLLSEYKEKIVVINPPTRRTNNNIGIINNNIFFLSITLPSFCTHLYSYTICRSRYNS